MLTRLLSLSVGSGANVPVTLWTVLAPVRNWISADEALLGRSFITTVIATLDASVVAALGVMLTR